jgi:hypothetical protein
MSAVNTFNTFLVASNLENGIELTLEGEITSVPISK